MISWSVAQFSHAMEAALAELFLRKPFLRQQLRHTNCASGISHSTDALATYYDFSPRFDTKTERDAMRPSTVPASCGNRKLGMSDYGCDGLEGPQTAVESAMWYMAMVLKKIPTTFANPKIPKIVSWNSYKMGMQFTHLSRRYLLYLSTLKPAYSVFVSIPFFPHIFYPLSLQYFSPPLKNRPDS